MTYSIFFSAGLGIGFIVGISLGLACWFLATKAAEVKYKGKITQLQQSAAVQRQNLDERIKQITLAYGNGASERHKEILSEELSSVLKGRKS